MRLDIYVHFPASQVDDSFHRRIEEMFHLLLTQGATIMSAQDDINTATQALDAKVTALEASNQALTNSQSAMIAELVVIKGLLVAATSQTPVDLTAMNHIGDRIDALTASDDAQKATDDAATAANAPA